MLKGLSIHRHLLSVFLLVGANVVCTQAMADSTYIRDSWPWLNRFEFDASAGPFFSTLENEQQTQINNLVVNKYHTSKETHWEALWGFGTAYSVGPFMDTPISASFGLAVYRVDLGKVKGTEYPFINSGVYDTLNYQFSAKSTSLFVESRLFYNISAWQPFVLFGVGTAWNTLSKYSETPTDPALSAAPVPNTFSSHTRDAVAYEVGVGVQHQLYQDMTHCIRYLGVLDYRYVNLGKARLASFPAQTTSSGLQTHDLSAQGLMFSLKVSFS